jgi:hypothetical protein
MYEISTTFPEENPMQTLDHQRNTEKLQVLNIMPIYCGTEECRNIRLQNKNKQNNKGGTGIKRSQEPNENIKRNCAWKLYGQATEVVLQTDILYNTFTD